MAVESSISNGGAVSVAADVLRLARDRIDLAERQLHASDSAGRFTDDDFERRPLAGLPPALLCPFSGRHDDVMISQVQTAPEAWYRAHCGICGVDAPGGQTELQAAEG
jgi:hypothetical protein